MSTERVPCKDPNCTNTILPVTAAANDGLCAPCVGKRKKAEHDEFIRKNRRTVNLYEGVSDSVEAICILLARRGYDPLIQYAPAPKTAEKYFAELSEAQIARLAGIAAEAMKSGKTDFAEDIGKSLATLRPSANLDHMLQTWVNARDYWPAVLFRRAGAGIRDQILKAMNLGETNVNHALQALAWIGDEMVQKKFTEWERHPPAWRKSLHVGPSIYVHIGGWEPVDGGRRNLYYEECFELAPVEGMSEASRVEFLAETQRKCPWCGDGLVHLIEIPTDNPSLAFLGFKGSTLPVLTCERCTAFSDHLFARINADGNAELHPANGVPRYLTDTKSEWGPGPWKGVRVKLQPRSAIHAVDWCMGIPGTQIGGMPSWVQDTAYPKCPDCKQTMRFLAQLDNGIFKWEGTYYAFWCAECRTTATAYQQT